MGGGLVDVSQVYVSVGSVFLYQRWKKFIFL